MKRTSILAASLLCSVMLLAQTKETAVLFSGTDLDDSYLLTENVSVVFDEEGNASICLCGTEQTEFELDGTNTLTAQFKDAFKLTANQDPDHEENYYSTFYTSEGAYKVPATAKAYIGEVASGKDGDVLQLTATAGGLIPASEAVILRATKSDVILMPSCSKAAASDDNMLQGSDEPMTLPDNSYALSLGQNGVGFYRFGGDTLPANKAYLTLASGSAISLRFSFGDATDIDAIETEAPARAYNLQGQQVDENYKGIVIVNGKKMYIN